MKLFQFLTASLVIAIAFTGCNQDANQSFFPSNQIVEDTLMLNPSGNAPLSAVNYYSTSESLKSTVIIKGKTLDDPDFIHEFTELKKNHEINILGLYPNHNNVVEIKYLNASDVIVDQQSFIISTDSVPEDFPNIQIAVNNSSLVEPGWNLMSYWGNGVPHSPIVFDERGNIRWYLDFSNEPDLMTLRYDNGIERLKNGNFYFGDINSNKIYEVDVLGKIINTWGLGDHVFHHNVQERENGNLLVTTSKNGSIHLNGDPTIEDFAIEIDRQSGNIIREWDLRQSLDENRDVLTSNFGNPVDWFHGNAIIENKDGGIIVSGRTQGLVSLSNTNQVNWIISTHNDWDTNRRGESLTPYLLAPLSNADQPISDTSVLNGYQNHSSFSWPWYAHAPFIMPNGNLLVFDNGDNRNFGNSSNYSRAVEYEIDENNQTIKQVWEYGKERGDETFGQYVSDVDFLPQTGNILFSPGFGTNNNGSAGGRIVEINYNTKNVVYEAIITPPAGVFVCFHRAERMNLY